MKFNNLQGAVIDGDSTAVYTFDLPGDPWILVHPGGDVNKPYFSALLSAQPKGRRGKLKKGVDLKMLEQNRKIDRKLYPRFIDAGEWGGWIDDDTEEPIEYSSERFVELINQLPDYLFDELRAFCNEPLNFLEDDFDIPSDEDIEDTVGN